MDAKAIFAGLSVLLAIMGALGIAYAVFRSATVTKTLELYKLENEALGKSVDRLQKDQIMQADRLATLEKENGVLKDMVTGKTAIEHLSNEVMKSEQLRHEEHAAMMALMRDMLGQLKDLWNQLRRRPGGDPGTGEIGRGPGPGPWGPSGPGDGDG